MSLLRLLVIKLRKSHERNAHISTYIRRWNELKTLESLGTSKCLNYSATTPYCIKYILTELLTKMLQQVRCYVKVQA